MQQAKKIGFRCLSVAWEAVVVAMIFLRAFADLFIGLAVIGGTCLFLMLAVPIGLFLSSDILLGGNVTAAIGSVVAWTLLFLLADWLGKGSNAIDWLETVYKARVQPLTSFLRLGYEDEGWCGH